MSHTPVEAGSPGARSVGIVIVRLGAGAVDDAQRRAIEELEEDRCSTTVRVVQVVNPADGGWRPETGELADAESRVRSVSLASGVDVIELAGNMGYGAAVNIGARWLGDVDALVVMTADARPEPRTLVSLVEHLQRPGVGLAAPSLRIGDAWRCGGNWSGRWGHARHRDQDTTPADTGVDWADGCCFAIDGSLFRDIGGFDPDTFMYGEDVLLGAEVRRRGRTVMVIGAARATQTSGMRSRPGAHGYLIARNELRALQRTGERGSRARGTLTGLARAAHQVRLAVTGPDRDHSWRQSVGMAWGVLDGLRDIGGPPPRLLAGWGDIPLPRTREPT